MTQKPDHERGFRDGIRWAITWLHTEGAGMNDPWAKSLCDMLADHMGKHYVRDPHVAWAAVKIGDHLAERRASLSTQPPT